MKAIEINGKISFVNRIPNVLDTEQGVILNARKLSDKELQKLGYYDFVKPAIDTDTQSLGNVYFDKKKKVFTREIIEKDFEATYDVLDENGEVIETKPAYDLEVKKQELIGKLKDICGSLLFNTDWQVTRLYERGIQIDEKVKEQRAKILAKCELKEKEVSEITKYVDALKYNTSFYTEQIVDGEVVVDEMGHPILAI